jgi:hypothetical protein
MTLQFLFIFSFLGLKVFNATANDIRSEGFIFGAVHNAEIRKVYLLTITQGCVFDFV